MGTRYLERGAPGALAELLGELPEADGALLVDRAGRPQQIEQTLALPAEELPSRRSTIKPCSLPALSVQARSTRVAETACAVSTLGAAGGPLAALTVTVAVEEVAALPSLSVATALRL